ncbi:cysteine-rich secretory family protein [Clostridioides difficile CD51]|nr:cysteine-rich secretory family protein [Clostridioides difficile CD51]
MNSEGHRKNILGNYNNIGVGVIFGGSYKTYYTQNFYK